MRASDFGWRAACAAWGEPSPPRLSPGGNGKGGSISLLPQAIRSRNWFTDGNPSLDWRSKIVFETSKFHPIVPRFYPHSK